MIHGQVQRNVQRFDEGVPAIRVAAEIRFAYAGDDMPCSNSFGKNGSKAEKQMVAAFNEGVGQRPVLVDDVHVMASQRIRA
ncbi:hypothetical protein D3C77_515870 [compost metagenome]